VVRKVDDQEKQPTKTMEDEAMPEVQDLLQVNVSKPNEDKTSALYCEASIKHIRFPLIVDSGSAGSIISLSLLKDLDMEITKASKTVMVNVNGERRRPLGAVTDIPLKIQDRIIPMDAIVTDANSYAAIVGNDWLRKTKAVLDYDSNVMTIKWQDETLEVAIECREMPHHIVSIEVPDMEADEEAEEEVEEEDESEEEYESENDDNAQEQLFCKAQFEKMREVKEEIKTGSPIENECCHQYEEIGKEKFHIGKSDEEQQHSFEKSFAWDANDLGRTSVISYSIDTGDATPIIQQFYRTSYQEEIQRLLKSGLIVPSKSQWTSPIIVVEKEDKKNHLCIDYQKLNKVTKRDNYHLPRVDDMLGILSGAQWSSSLDLASGLWQEELNENDRKKSTALMLEHSKHLYSLFYIIYLFIYLFVHLFIYLYSIHASYFRGFNIILFFSFYFYMFISILLYYFKLSGISYYQHILVDLLQIFPTKVECPVPHDLKSTLKKKFVSVKRFIEEAKHLGVRQAQLARAFFLGRFLERGVNFSPLRSHFAKQHYQIAVVRVFHNFKMTGVKQIIRITCTSLMMARKLNLNEHQELRLIFNGVEKFTGGMMLHANMIDKRWLGKCAHLIELSII
jgi:hypothetical protein